MLFTRNLSHAPPARVGDLVVAILVLLVALAATITSLAIIRPVKHRPRWYIPLLSFTTVTLLITLTLSIAADAIGGDPWEGILGRSLEGDLWGALGGPSPPSDPSILSYRPLVAAGGALFAIFECSLFAAMFLTLRHRLLSPIALASPPSTAHIIKLAIDVGVVVLFTIMGIAAAALKQDETVTSTVLDFFIPANPAKSLGDAAVAFYVLASIDVIATVFYVRSQLRQAYLLNDQISRSFLLVIVPLVSLRTLYSIIARGISNTLIVDTDLTDTLNLTNKLFVALPSLGIIAALLLWGTPSRVAAWNLRNTGELPVPTTTNALNYSTSTSVTGSGEVDKGHNNA